MAWEMDSDRPIYTQLYDKILVRIVCGVYKAGTRLPSVRDLAAEANVNPNTMQRAFTELERSGLVVTQRNAGRVVTGDMQMIGNARHGLAMKQINSFFANMRELGYTDKEAMELINNIVTTE
ncbi:MAG: GntR family transcriptional regulator [Butyrivibrio sp.]|nr:GntR family transcriptional regulator [Butyrivibrio sp.]